MVPIRRWAATALLLLASAGPALATPAGSLLKALKLPSSLANLYAANALGQTSLNGQVAGSPEALLAQVRTSLAIQGYKERTVNTVVGPWGFNLVLDPPETVMVDGTPAGKKAALVLQSTSLGPDKLNLNVRYEGL